MSRDGGRHILATSGGLRRDARGGVVAAPLLDHALSLSGATRPRLCLVGTATGDDPWWTAMLHGAFAGRDDVVLSHLSLFLMPNVDDIAGHLLSQDVIWVGGGSVANLLALWRLHGVDEAMRAAWEAGVVLTGVSAGSICWHVGGTTDSFGPDLRPVTNGLGLLPYGNGVHYDSEEQRRPLLHRLVADGTLPTSYATDDGAGLHYVGTGLHEALAEKKGAGAYVVRRAPDGTAVETPLPVRLLRPA
ncbi:MAG: Type 1 glutamine amidotransferase-like domain-containing protein [Frankiaceae bacterium]